MKAKENSLASSKSDSRPASKDVHLRTENNAVLASALLFPGAGHIILNKRIIGICLIALAGAAFLVLAYDAFIITQEISKKIVASGTIPNVFVLRDMIYDALFGQDSPRFKACITVLIGTWLVGIIDTLRYRIIKQRG